MFSKFDEEAQKILIMAKKLIYFILLFLYVIGAIGGIGYTVYIHEYVIAAGVAVLAGMAYPTAKKLFNEMQEI